MQVVELSGKFFVVGAVFCGLKLAIEDDGGV